MLVRLVLVLCILSACKKSPTQAVVQTDGSADVENLELKAALQMLQQMDFAQNSALAFASRVLKCVDDPVKQARFTTQVFKGMVVDGALGDVCFAGDVLSFCAVEGLRGIVSIQPFGAEILHRAGFKSSQDRVREASATLARQLISTTRFLEREGPFIQEYLEKVINDKSYREAQAMQIASILSLGLGSVLNQAQAASCEAVRDELGSIIGLLGYEVVMTVGLAAVTLPEGSVAGGIKFAALVAKLERIIPTLPSRSGAILRAFTKSMREVLEQLMQIFRRSGQASDPLNAEAERLARKYIESLGRTVSAAEAKVIQSRSRGALRLARETGESMDAAHKRLDKMGLLISGLNITKSLRRADGTAVPLHRVVSEVAEQIDGGWLTLQNMKRPERMVTIEGVMEALYKTPSAPADELKFRRDLVEVITDIAPTVERLDHVRYRVVTTAVSEQPSLSEIQALAQTRAAGTLSTGFTPGFEFFDATLDAQKSLVVFRYPSGTYGFVVNGEGRVSEFAREAQALRKARAVSDQPFVNNEFMIFEPAPVVKNISVREEAIEHLGSRRVVYVDL